MGVPAFFKWLTMRYPKVVMDAFEEVNDNFNINEFLKNNYNNDTSMPYIDNLYLDMNGIIHPCCHPIDKPQPSSEKEMFENIFEYTDKLIKIIKPQKLIYLAVDGVAPRAKMNQQRSRRFRAAIEAETKNKKELELLKEWKGKGLKAPESKKPSFDSNVITPGTIFMTNLSAAIKEYISERLKNDPLWKGTTVIYSDSSVPGEGEHKILDFIRTQRLQEFYNPNTRHCIYGADADLIMLALITHEPNFYIIRESLNENIWKKCEICGKNGHTKDDCNKFKKEGQQLSILDNVEFSMIKVHVVREYLELEFKGIKFHFGYDFERIIDDFVFLCFFVGNDFIPHLPSLKIREGAIDALIYIYKKIIPELDGYLTEGNGKINLHRTGILFDKLAKIENAFFENQLRIKQREVPQESKHDIVFKEFNEIKANKVKSQNEFNQDEIQLFEDVFNDIENIINKHENKDDAEDKTIQKLSKEASNNFQRVLKEYLKIEEKKKLNKYQDSVRLGECGWKERYYRDKFKVSSDNYEFLNLIKKSYIEGICWVYEYYYNGCPSWEWYYPFHYAPFASDLIDIFELTIIFNIGEPFKPIEQLLSVLPPYSSYALPECLRHLMHDADSEIADFYPSNICLDVNGHAFAWMGVNLIPFIEEDRIRKSIEKFQNKFLPEEEQRNNFGYTLVYFNKENHFLNRIVGERLSNPNHSVYLSNPIFRTLTGLLKSHEFVITNSVISLIFESPQKQLHRGVLLENVKIPDKVVYEDNINMYSKKIFKGEQAIRLVQSTLGYIDENIREDEFRRDYFDKTYNNNRAIEYNPGDMDMLRRKRYQQTKDIIEEDNREYNRDYKRDQNREYKSVHNREYSRDHNREYNKNKYDRKEMYNDKSSSNKKEHQIRNSNKESSHDHEKDKTKKDTYNNSSSLLSEFFNEDKKNNNRDTNYNINNTIENIIKTYKNYTSLNKK